MKFSENWLRTWVNPLLDSAGLQHQLTMAGLEVEGIEPAATPLPLVVVGAILSAEPHPNADRLQICRVDVAQKDPLQIVCGAKNARIGIKVPCALVGAQLPGVKIEAAQVRGVDSFGMLCSATELQLADTAEGLLELPTDAPVGETIYDYLQLGDVGIEIKLTPNRADCFSLRGIAREVAALNALPLNEPKIDAIAVNVTDNRIVRLVDGEACPLYVGRVITGVDARVATPTWMSTRLTRSGLRSISAIVDITNYVMLELGQPLHAFDQAKLQGDIDVRRARADETLRLLNEKTIALDTDLLVIADASGPIALAGVMGGANTEVTTDTQAVFLEAAFFHPDAIAGRSRRLGFSSDSAHRFERGVDYAQTRQALERASQLILDICGGQAGPITQASTTLPSRPTIDVHVSKVNRLLGTALHSTDMTHYLQSLQFDVIAEADILRVTPPSFRFDIAIAEDLIEEIARMVGYDHLPVALPALPQPMLPVAEDRRTAQGLLATLIGQDYQQVINFAFVEARWEADFAGNAQPIKLQNPIASQLAVMRSTLVGGLIETLRHNLAYKQPRVRIAEHGTVFLRDQKGIVQPDRIAGLAYGDALPEQWGTPARMVDFFDVKRDLEILLTPQVLEARRPSDAKNYPAAHPGRLAELWVDGQQIGWLGELHPRLRQAYDLPRSPIVFELDVAAIAAKPLPRATPVSKFQPVRRDIALVVPNALPLADLLASLRDKASSRVQDIGLFDVFFGKGVPEGCKSLALRILMQDTDRTLTDEEVTAEVEGLIAAATAMHGAHLRA